MRLRALRGLCIGVERNVKGPTFKDGDGGQRVIDVPGDEFEVSEEEGQAFLSLGGAVERVVPLPEPTQADVPASANDLTETKEGPAAAASPTT